MKLIRLAVIAALLGISVEAVFLDKKHHRRHKARKLHARPHNKQQHMSVAQAGGPLSSKLEDVDPMGHDHSAQFGAMFGGQEDDYGEEEPKEPQKPMPDDPELAEWKR